MKIITLIKMRFNEAYGKFCTGEHLSHKFHIQNSLNQGDAISPLLFNYFFLE
jgi:hypothetical protein